MNMGSQLAGGWWACEMGRGCEKVLGQKMGSQGAGVLSQGGVGGCGDRRTVEVVLRLQLPVKTQRG